MRKAPCSVILSDFNVANLAACLRADEPGPAMDVHACMVPGVTAALHRDAALIEGMQLAIVWMHPERVSKVFVAALDGHPVAAQQALEEVDAFADELRTLAARVPSVLVAAWTLAARHRAFGLPALKHDTGVANLLLRMNLRLADQLASASNVHLLDPSRWMLAGATDAFNPRLWYLAKIPYATVVFRAAAHDIKAAWRGITGEARKVVLLDLDDTLWGGLVGEAGWEALRIGGHDPVGEAYADFQRALKALSNRGILLAIVSKNEQEAALTALRQHPEMLLRPHDFAAYRINWRDKAENVADILAELNLGPHAAIFIDDQPSERARVRDALPGVLVPEWPASPLFYTQALLTLDCFDAPSLTDEDRSRTALYRAERARAAARREVGSLDEWLERLGVCVRIAEMTDSSCQRAVQLLNKTNQMNLTTRRLSETELRAWGSAAGRHVWTFRVSDRFGDAGLTGLLSLQADGDTATIVDFVVSCRVLGRRVEDAMLHYAVEHARRAGLARIVARFEPTARNGPCLHFFERSGFANGDGRTFWWDLAIPHAAPTHVWIEQELDR